MASNILCTLASMLGLIICHPVSAQINKCTINGQTIYTDKVCPHQAIQSNVKPDRPSASGSSTVPLPSRTHLAAKPASADLSEFATRLYATSVYTAEEQFLRSLVDAEVQLVTSRWLSRKLAANQHRVPPHAPQKWDEMVAELRRALIPVVQTHLTSRTAALKRAGLEGMAPYIDEYIRLIQTPPSRGNIQFSDGSNANEPGTPQTDDIPEILAFHQTGASNKWRLFWPDLRAYGAQLMALQYRAAGDPALGQARDWNVRAAALAQLIGGKVLSQQETQALAQNRLGFTMQGLGRFIMPLGTELVSGNPMAESMVLESQGNDVVITQRTGANFEFRLVDARWDRDFANRLTRAELKLIDEALTATFQKTKGRWFAPLELDFDAYMNVSKKLRASTEMRQMYQSFNTAAEAAMSRVWTRWTQR